MGPFMPFSTPFFIHLDPYHVFSAWMDFRASLPFFFSVLVVYAPFRDV